VTGADRPPGVAAPAAHPAQHITSAATVSTAFVPAVDLVMAVTFRRAGSAIRRAHERCWFPAARSRVPRRGTQ
jgi:hypothetical protein